MHPSPCIQSRAKQEEALKKAKEAQRKAQEEITVRKRALEEEQVIRI